MVHICSDVGAGLIWSEIKQLWDVGMREYISDMWNVVDFITNSLYVATIALRITAYYDVSHLTIAKNIKIFVSGKAIFRRHRITPKNRFFGVSDQQKFYIYIFFIGGGGSPVE
jgi:hypothetical protein